MSTRARWFLASIWLALAGLGTGALMVYDQTPGVAASVPKSWPTASHIPLSSQLPTLIMFAHPKCPCTRASIGELAIAMTHCQGKVNAWVVFYKPKGADPSWTQTDLWRSAAAIPGVQVRASDEGAESSLFNASTSGQVLLYDVHGRLLFSGGITSARGHSGDNDGRLALVQILRGQTVNLSDTPVFGCSLVTPNHPNCSACTR